jgi:hypothetical protein
VIQVQLVKFRDGEAIWHPSAPWPLCLHCIHVGDFRVSNRIHAKGCLLRKSILRRISASRP